MQSRWNFLRFACAILCTNPLVALDPTYKISQYLHRAWKIDSGLQSVRRVKQTAEGYLWLATRGGLVRFDGVRFTTYVAGSVPGLESSTIQDLLADGDGSLWVATLGGGLSRYRQGRFRSYGLRDGLPSNDIAALYRDHRGVLWVGTRDGKIARMVQGRFEKVRLEVPGAPILGFIEDADQSLWIATYGGGVFRLRDGAVRRFSEKDGIPDIRVSSLYRDRVGKIWTVGSKGLSYWNGQRFVPDRVINRSVAYAVGCTEDRDGNLWIASSSGLVRARAGEVTKMDRESGLSGDFVSDVFEDREGNLWVGTRFGLDRLRDGPVRMFTSKEGLAGSIMPIVAAEAGGILTMSGGEIIRIAGNGIEGGHQVIPGDRTPITLLPQPDSGFLIGLNSGAMRWNRHGGRWVPELAGLDIQCLLRAHDGSIWIGTANRGLLHWNPSSGSRKLLETGIRNRIGSVAEDRAGVIWAGSISGDGLYRISGTKIENYREAEGLRSGIVYALFEDSEGVLWIGSAAGLSWFENGRLQTVSSRDGLPSNQVFALVDDDYGRLWFTGYGGIASVEKSSLVEWAARRRKLTPTDFRGADGAQPYPAPASRTFPNAVRSLDGHLWFSTGDGISEVTPPAPGALRGNEFQVRIEDVAVDGIPAVAREHLRFAPGTRSIQIGFTALTLSNPDTIRFRYRLEGVDKNWINVDSRRTAFYNNLKPGEYQFRVSASASGTDQWRDAPALELEQLPFFYQTLWFMLLVWTAVVSVIIIAAWAAYRQRLYQVARQFEARLAERTRIARELHDTLLQSFHGSMFRMQAARNLLPLRPEEAGEALDGAIARTEQAIAEGRNAIQDLRSEAAIGSDITQLLKTMGQELAASQQERGDPAMFRLTVEGEHKALSPFLQDEVYRIAREVLTNAFQHARARQIEAEIRYNARVFRLRIRDDGTGIDPRVLKQGERAGHWGLPGIRERAKQIGARLDFWSEAGVGTEMQLRVPASIAYIKSDSARGITLFPEKRDTHAH